VPQTVLYQSTLVLLALAERYKASCRDGTRSQSADHSTRQSLPRSYITQWSETRYQPTLVRLALSERYKPSRRLGHAYIVSQSQNHSPRQRLLYPDGKRRNDHLNRRYSALPDKTLDCLLMTLDQFFTRAYDAGGKALSYPKLLRRNPCI
jgi:hypothetical protein